MKDECSRGRVGRPCRVSVRSGRPPEVCRACGGRFSWTRADREGWQAGEDFACPECQTPVEERRRVRKGQETGAGGGFEGARLLRVEEVAELLGVATGTLYNWRYRGEGPKSVRAGKRVRYRYADIEAWLDEQQAEEARLREVLARGTGLRGR